MESNSDADDDEYCLIINSNVEYEIINNHSVKEQKSQKKLFATFHVEGKPAKFQLDSGVTCNVIPVDLLADKTNPRNAIEYDVDFVVVDGNECAPILGNATIQEMDLVRVQHHNIMSLKTVKPR